MPNTRCEQDLVGFNPQNSGQVLTIGVATVVNDALVIDTRGITPYFGTVQLNISDEQGMTAVFVESGTTALTKTVVANQLLYIPLRVTATDCGYDRCGYWQFTVYYDSDPYYGADTGGVEPEICGKPDRKLKICRFDAKIQNKCIADFLEKLVSITGTGTYNTRFNLGYSPQCTGPVTVVLSTVCNGIRFVADSLSGFTYTLSNDDTVLTVVGDYSASSTDFPFSFVYDGQAINCVCEIKASISYESCDNPNLITDYNGGTMSGYNNQAQFNTAGVLARTSTVFQTVLNPVSGTALRTIIDTPVDYLNRPLPGTPVNPNATDGSIVWQGDINTPVSITSGKRYWLKAKARMPENSSLPPLIRANEEVHLDRYFVVGSGTFNPAIPYFSQYTPKNQWHDIGIRWESTGVSPSITPFVRYVQTFLPTALIGDLYLNDGGISDWANVELRRYYPSDCIECPERTMTVVNEVCSYETVLDYQDPFQENWQCVKLLFDDNSLFGYTPGHDISDFTLYRKLTVTYPNGNQVVASSVVPYNILITPAASGDIIDFYTSPLPDQGYYQFTLCNVPTFNPAVTYNGSDDTVCLLDGSGNIKFYRSILSASGYTPGITMGWQNYWEEIQESELPEKYCDSTTYIPPCLVNPCITEYLDNLYCSIEDFCSVDICKNECIQNYLFLISIGDAFNTETSGDDVRDLMNYLNKICSSCKCT